MSQFIRGRNGAAWSSLVLSVLLAGGWAAAQEPGTITVLGGGVSSASPTYVVLKGKLAASSENAEEAVKQFRKQRETLEDNVAKLDMTRLRLHFGGERLTSGATAEGAVAISSVYGVGETPLPAGQVGVSEDLELRIDFEGDMERIQAIEKAAKLVAAAQGAGVSFSQAMNPMMAAMGGQASGVLEFGIDDSRAVQAAAYKKAVEDARARAESLATLAGARLGRIVSIEEIEIETGENPYLSAIAWSMQQGSDSKETRFTTDRNTAVEVRKDLKVVFQLLSE
ncbi:MAG: SIMPL domain-containing protein [Pirellulaceae bacterium]